MSESGKETGFTPGPWSITNEEGRRQFYPFTIFGADGYYVADVIDLNDEKDGNLANARLIAAAPALYEALSDLLELLDEVAPGYSHSTVAFAARSALLLSTGGTGNG